MTNPLDRTLPLVCPISKLPLTECVAESLTDLNDRIAAGAVRGADGAPFTDRLAGALVRSDGLVAYPVVRGIPVLLPAAALHL